MDHDGLRRDLAGRVLIHRRKFLGLLPADAGTVLQQRQRQRRLVSVAGQLGTARTQHRPGPLHPRCRLGQRVGEFTSPVARTRTLPAAGRQPDEMRFAFGDLASLFVLDGRQYRTDQVCGDTVPVDTTSCDELGDHDTMLGTEQEHWLTEGLSASTATWNILAQQKAMKSLMLDNGVDNVMVLTGDIHAGGAADLHAPDAGTEGPIVAHELVMPGISSPGLAGAVGGSGSLPVEQSGLVYSNLDKRGYNRCIVTPETWRTEFLVVDSIAEPGGEVTVDGTVEVRAGEPGLRVV